MTLKRMSTMVLVLGGMAGHAYATNGMNVEGFGPIASSLGGASMAYDNGAAAMMNNPATLGLGAEGDTVSLMIGYLGPDVSVVGEKSSGGDAYYMPAAGWTRKSGSLTYGVGMFAQGGMGTEYARGVDGLPERSELGVGRLIAPLVYNVSPKLSIGGSVDFVWAMLDLQMAMPIASMANLITEPGNGTIGGALGGMITAGYDNARLDYSDDSDYSGKAKGHGFAGKIGFTYKISDTVNVGGTYHSKTSLGDLETGSVGASMIVTDTVNPTQTVPGKISVRDFQWPETFGLGVAVQASPEWMFAADWKRINWRDVMKSFTMTYTAMGDSVTFALPQNWENQDVLQLGLAYKATAALTLRAGASFSDSPVPDSTLNYLFPAIVKNHYMAGLGYAINDRSGVDFSLQFAPEVEQTDSIGRTISHSQTNWQLLYSMRF
ncbi:MAG: outer membrane protein transport protein [Thiobacillus sp.]|nr:outer membrane protein transport protein [Thiobacillus sp.]MDP1924287.1 outer membrane protein transport protein [Thiobacillus sp.]MDP3126151.1 outer membrane protein transport protein [Thiobacillus sp.]